MQADSNKDQILETIEDGFFTLDRKWSYSCINRKAANIIGMRPKELIGKVIWEVSPEISGTNLEKVYRQAMELQVAQRIEMKGLLTGRWYNIIAFPSTEGISVYWQDISEQKKVEKKLKRSEERFRAYMLESFDTIYCMSPDWSEMCQLDSKGVLSNTESPDENWFQKYIHPEDQPQVTAVINKAICEKSIFELEHRVLHVDGSLGWTFSRAVPLLNVEGEIIEWFVAAKDITARKQTEAALAESEKQYRELVKYAPVGIYEVDFRSKRFLSVNDAMCQFTGYSREELLEMTPFDLLDDQSQITFQTRISQWLSGEEPDQNVDYKVKTKKGREIYASLNVSFKRDENGKPLGATVISHDITERKRVEEALCDSEERFRIAVKNSNLVLSQFDLDLRYTWISKPHLDSYPTVIIGKRDEELEESEGMQRLFDLKRQVVQNGKGVREEISFRRSDGVHTYDFFIEPLYDEAGIMIGGTTSALDITVYKLTKEALLESEERLKALVNYNPSLVFLKDELGRYVYLNETYEKQFIQSKDWYGKTDFDLWPKESAELFSANDANVLKSGQIQQFLEDSTDLKGTRYCWLCYKFPFTDSKNRRYLGGIGINATERILVEEALQAELKRIAVLREVAAIAVKTMDAGKQSKHVLVVCRDLLGAKTGNIYVADKCEGVLRALALEGFSEEFLREVHEIPFDQKAVALFSFFEDSVITHDSDSSPKWMATCEKVVGTYDDFRWIVLPIHMRGDVSGVLKLSFEGRRPFSQQEIEFFQVLADQLGIGIGRANALEALERSEQKYRSLFEAMDEGFFICEPIFDKDDQVYDFKIVEMNGAFKRLRGLPLARMVGWPVSEVYPDLADLFRKKYKRINETGEPVRVENYVPTVDGWLDVHIFPCGNDRLAILCYDITELKRVQEELRKADQNKNTFLNILSHELRNPLASITMSLSLLDRVPSYSKQAINARKIAKRQGEQLTRLVDDLLDITRITQNKIILKKENVELNQLVQKAIEDYRQQFMEKEVALETKISSNPIYFEADPARLIQVIGNLLHNSAKFTEKGDKTLVTVSMDKKTREAVIKIKDTGIGIKPELLPDLFELFVQVDSSLDRTHGGLGLGLAVVKGMVELHGGSVTAHSEGLGCGTQFTIRLPVKNSDEEKQEDNRKGITARSFKILVIDDIPDIAEILSSLLCYLGHEVLIAFSGHEGLAKAKEFKPEVVICDIGLPGMNGYEVAKSLSSDKELKDTFLIALSGYAQPEDLELSREAGFDTHLAKPVNLDTLEQVLAEVSFHK